MKNDWILKEEVNGINISVYVCMKKIPNFLYIPEGWYREIKTCWNDDKDLPQNLAGEWVISFCNLDFCSFFSQQESNFVATMRLIDYCSSEFMKPKSERNVLFYKLENKVSPFFNDKEKRKIFFELDK